MTDEATASEPKQYRISNKEPGPRGVSTAAQGLVLVHPTPEGAPGSTIATLTDEEASRAKAQGLTLKALKGGQIQHGTANRPAAGFVDVNAPDAGEHMKTGKGAHSAAEAAEHNAADRERASRAKSGEQKAPEPKPYDKMNRAELDAEVEKAKANGFTLSEDATSNKKIAAELQAHADASK